MMQATNLWALELAEALAGGECPECGENYRNVELRDERGACELCEELRIGYAHNILDRAKLLEMGY
jgi:hypothetical protein